MIFACPRANVDLRVLFFSSYQGMMFFNVIGLGKLTNESLTI